MRPTRQLWELGCSRCLPQPSRSCSPIPDARRDGTAWHLDTGSPVPILSRPGSNASNAVGRTNAGQNGPSNRRDDNRYRSHDARAVPTFAYGRSRTSDCNGSAVGITVDHTRSRPGSTGGSTTIPLECPVAGRHQFDQATVLATDGWFREELDIGPTPTLTVDARALERFTSAPEEIPSPWFRGNTLPATPGQG